ncbi:MAG: AmmeMemoRadiSam system radical SAM enzyme, partial [Gaiellales bacterium]
MPGPSILASERNPPLSVPRKSPKWALICLILLTCSFCQNWGISKSREMDTLADRAPPDAIAHAARRLGCASVAYTYNDPVIFLEYAVETAAACREAGVRSVAVTAGYVCDEPRSDFFEWMDAANVDLKAFSDDFYRRFCSARLEPVLETLRHLARGTRVWLEITTLLIPGANDSDDEIHRASEWIVENLGRDVPWHFTAFLP